jgi:putative ABC transport system ATP-binding protein
VAEPRLRVADLQSRLAGPFELAIAAGECVAVSGASGAGKSLLLRMIADLDPSDGEAYLDGAARSAIPAPAWRRQVAYLAAEPGWWDDAVAAHFPDLTTARAMAARLDLKPELFDGAVLRLSTGERQRLALVRTLLAAPPALLLDEPTGALDEGSRGLVETLLRERLETGCAMLLVTHDPAQAARLARRRFVMAGGRLRLP